jgi:peptidyl-tRNA hydrolase, PTH2 family
MLLVVPPELPNESMSEANPLTTNPLTTIELTTIGPADVKQVIVIRRDLHMRRGKEIAQGSHASSGWLADIVTAQLAAPESEISMSEAAKVWLTTSHRKITLQTHSEDELISLAERSRAAGLLTHLIQDSGKTEFNGVPTYTALAIGPDLAVDVDAITGQLSIY